MFAEWLIDARNPWFTRNLVNRVWSWLLGRGIIQEPDDIRADNPPSNPALLTNLAVNYTSPNAAGTLTFDPVTNAFGSTLVTITVNDGNPSNNLVSRTFTVTINPVNSPPGLNPISNVTRSENSGPIVVPLDGINAGGPDESQVVNITATSGNHAVVPDPVVSCSGGASGSLTLTPVSQATGSSSS